MTFSWRNTTEILPNLRFLSSAIEISQKNIAALREKISSRTIYIFVCMFSFIFFSTITLILYDGLWKINFPSFFIAAFMKLKNRRCEDEWNESFLWTNNVLSAWPPDTFIYHHFLLDKLFLSTLWFIWLNGPVFDQIFSFISKSSIVCALCSFGYNM